MEISKSDYKMLKLGSKPKSSWIEREREDKQIGAEHRRRIVAKSTPRSKEEKPISSKRGTSDGYMATAYGHSFKNEKDLNAYKEMKKSSRSKALARRGDDYKEKAEIRKHFSKEAKHFGLK
jgi:hypothetical protein